MPDFPGSMTVQYEVYLISDQANATFVVSSPKLLGHLTLEQLTDYTDARIDDVIAILNDTQSVTDFRTMTAKEVDLFLRGFHKHSHTNPEEYHANVGFRH